MKFERSSYVEVSPIKGLPFDTNSKAGVGSNPEFDTQLKIVFEVEKSLEAAQNSAIIDIYNLNQQNQKSVAYKFNQLNSQLGQEFGGEISLFAGYDSNEKLIYKGDIISAVTGRQGADFITRIEAKTHAKIISGKRINRTFPKGSSYKSIIDYIIGELDLPAVKAEVQAVIDKTTVGTILKSGETFFGNIMDVVRVINDRFEGKLALNIDERGINVLPPGYSTALIPKYFYNKFTGLRSPESTHRGVNINVPLEPDIRSSDLIFVDSTATDNLGIYRYAVRSFKHIGNNREGEFITSMVCWYATNAALLPLPSPI